MVAPREFSADDAVAVEGLLPRLFSCNEMTNSTGKFCLFALFLLTLSACGGQLYKVATPAKVAPPPLTAAENELSVAAKVLTGDESLAQFDANLLLAGIVAVDVRLANRTVAAIPLNTLRWDLNDGGKTLFKLLPPKKALKRVMGFYGNTVYRPDAYQSTYDSYERLALPLATSLEANAEVRGFLFFESKYEATGLTGLTLSVSGPGTPLQVKLN